jgi:cellulose 1,4-beta-cellobiosidase
MNFITQSNIGSRIYLLNGDNYYYPNLLNKEIRLDIDLSNVNCGLNAAVYLVEMKSSAFPKFGGGYVDAQCPKDIKIKPDGTFNTDFSFEACGVEIDLIEANNDAMAFTLHPCIENSCYSAGSDFNSYRQGYKDFYGLHKVVDTTKPFTFITQFIGDSNNNLIELRRSYKQNNKIIDHPAGYMNKSSISYWMKKLNEPDDLDKYGGFESLTKSLKNGMVIVLSIWDDTATNMKWLDVGERGRCSGNEIPRNIYRDAYVIYSNLEINDISTKSDLSCTSSKAKDIDCSCIYNCFVKNDQFK